MGPFSPDFPWSELWKWALFSEGGAFVHYSVDILRRQIILKAGSYLYLEPSNLYLRG